MSRPVFYVAMGILITAIVVLMLAGDSGVAGLSGDRLAQVAQLGAIGLMIAAGLMTARHRMNLRLWHVAVWLAVLVGLMAGYQMFGGSFGR